MGIRFRKQTRQPFGRGRGAVCFNQSSWVSGNNKADMFSFTFSSPSPLSFPLFLLVLKTALDPAAPASPPWALTFCEWDYWPIQPTSSPSPVWFSLSGACCLEPGCLGRAAGDGSLPLPEELFGLSEANGGTNSSKWAEVFSVELICPGMLCCVL